MHASANLLQPVVGRVRAPPECVLHSSTRAKRDPSLQKARDKLHLIVQTPLRSSGSLCVTPTVSRSEIVGGVPQSRDVVIGHPECCYDRLATSKVVLRVLIHHVEVRCVAISPPV